jgi:hypothetical protein
VPRRSSGGFFGFEPGAHPTRAEPDRVEQLSELAPDAERNLAGRQQLVAEHLGDGEGLDLAKRDIAIHVPPPEFGLGLTY